MSLSKNSMRSFVVFGNYLKDEAVIGTHEIHLNEKIAIEVGTVMLPLSRFSPFAQKYRRAVHVRTLAFSCNYRDRALLFSASRNKTKGGFFVIGSEFVGEVIEIGTDVTKFNIGDRVISNASWNGVRDDSSGLPTNNASREFHIIDERKLMKIPKEIPLDVAASITVGGQTACSILRRLDLQPKTNVLVTAATSNTSLFLLSLLANLNVNVVAVTTRVELEQRLMDLGADEVVNVKDQEFTQVMGEVVSRTGLFNYVIDPFFDLYLRQVISIMAFEGKYVTCGLSDKAAFREQGALIKHNTNSLNDDILVAAIINNLQLIGNCLGTTADLGHAVEYVACGKLKVMLDSTYSSHEVRGFFERTFVDSDRFGKVACVYR